MKKDYQKAEVRRDMYEELHRLMEEAHQIISDKKGGHLYDSLTHIYLMRNGWEIMFPLEKERWPNMFFEKIVIDYALPWPQYATYAYIMNVLYPPAFSPYSLYFGYAVIDGKLVRTAFFTIETIVKYQIMPQAMVIDPLCFAHGITPDYYIGCPVEKQDIEEGLLSRKGPLELFVKRKSEQELADRLYNDHIMVYDLQLAYEPGYFPPQLIKFAEKNNLYVPPQERRC